MFNDDFGTWGVAQWWFLLEQPLFCKVARASGLDFQVRGRELRV